MIAFQEGCGARAVSARILARSARNAESATVFAAQQDVGQGAGHELSYQIAHVELGAVEYVVLAEGVARSARRIETLLDLDRHRDDDVLQTAVAWPLDVGFDGAADVQAPVDAPQVEPDVRRVRERERGERRNLDPFVERDRAPREQDGSDVDDLC